MSKTRSIQRAAMQKKQKENKYMSLAERLERWWNNKFKKKVGKC